MAPAPPGPHVASPWPQKNHQAEGGKLRGEKSRQADGGKVHGAASFDGFSVLSRAVLGEPSVDVAPWTVLQDAGPEANESKRQGSQKQRPTVFQKYVSSPFGTTSEASAPLPLVGAGSVLTASRLLATSSEPSDSGRALPKEAGGQLQSQSPRQETGNTAETSLPASFLRTLPTEDGGQLQLQSPRQETGTSVPAGLLRTALGGDEPKLPQSVSSLVGLLSSSVAESSGRSRSPSKRRPTPREIPANIEDLSVCSPDGISEDVCHLTLEEILGLSQGQNRFSVESEGRCSTPFAARKSFLDGVAKLEKRQDDALTSRDASGCWIDLGQDADQPLEGEAVEDEEEVHEEHEEDKEEGEESTSKTKMKPVRERTQLRRQTTVETEETEESEESEESDEDLATGLSDDEGEGKPKLSRGSTKRSTGPATPRKNMILVRNRDGEWVREEPGEASVMGSPMANAQAEEDTVPQTKAKAKKVPKGGLRRDTVAKRKHEADNKKEKWASFADEQKNSAKSNRSTRFADESPDSNCDPVSFEEEENAEKKKARRFASKRSVCTALEASLMMCELEEEKDARAKEAGKRERQARRHRFAGPAREKYRDDYGEQPENSLQNGKVSNRKSDRPSMQYNLQTWSAMWKAVNNCQKSVDEIIHKQGATAAHSRFTLRASATQRDTLMRITLKTVEVPNFLGNADESFVETTNHITQHLNLTATIAALRTILKKDAAKGNTALQQRLDTLEAKLSKDRTTDKEVRQAHMELFKFDRHTCSCLLSMQKRAHLAEKVHDRWTEKTRIEKMDDGSPNRNREDGQKREDGQWESTNDAHRETRQLLKSHVRESTQQIQELKEQIENPMGAIEGAEPISDMRGSSKEANRRVSLGPTAQPRQRSSIMDSSDSDDPADKADPDRRRSVTSSASVASFQPPSIDNVSKKMSMKSSCSQASYLSQQGLQADIRQTMARLKKNKKVGSAWADPAIELVAALDDQRKALDEKFNELNDKIDSARKELVSHLKFYGMLTEAPKRSESKATGGVSRYSGWCFDDLREEWERWEQKRSAAVVAKIIATHRNNRLERSTHMARYRKAKSDLDLSFQNMLQIWRSDSSTSKYKAWMAAALPQSTSKQVVSLEAHKDDGKGALQLAEQGLTTTELGLDNPTRPVQVKCRSLLLQQQAYRIYLKDRLHVAQQGGFFDNLLNQLSKTIGKTDKELRDLTQAHNACIVLVGSDVQLVEKFRQTPEYKEFSGNMGMEKTMQKFEFALKAAIFALSHEERFLENFQDRLGGPVAHLREAHEKVTLLASRKHASGSIIDDKGGCMAAAEVTRIHGGIDTTESALNSFRNAAGTWHQVIAKRADALKKLDKERAGYLMILQRLKELQWKEIQKQYKASADKRREIKDKRWGAMKSIQTRFAAENIDPKIFGVDAVEAEIWMLQQLLEEEATAAQLMAKSKLDTIERLRREGECKKIGKRISSELESQANLERVLSQLNENGDKEDATMARIMTEIIHLVRRLADVDKSLALQLIRSNPVLKFMHRDVASREASTLSEELCLDKLAETVKKADAFDPEVEVVESDSNSEDSDDGFGSLPKHGSDSPEVRGTPPRRTAVLESDSARRSFISLSEVAVASKSSRPGLRLNTLSKVKSLFARKNTPGNSGTPRKTCAKILMDNDMANQKQRNLEAKQAAKRAWQGEAGLEFAHKRLRVLFERLQMKLPPEQVANIKKLLDKDKLEGADGKSGEQKDLEKELALTEDNLETITTRMKEMRLQCLPSNFSETSGDSGRGESLAMFDIEKVRDGDLSSDDESDEDMSASQSTGRQGTIQMDMDAMTAQNSMNLARDLLDGSPSRGVKAGGQEAEEPDLGPFLGEEEQKELTRTEELAKHRHALERKATMLAKQERSDRLEEARERQAQREDGIAQAMELSNHIDRAATLASLMSYVPRWDEAHHVRFEPLPASVIRHRVLSSFKRDGVMRVFANLPRESHTRQAAEKLPAALGLTSLNELHALADEQPLPDVVEALTTSIATLPIDKRAGTHGDRLEVVGISETLEARTLKSSPLQKHLIKKKEPHKMQKGQSSAHSISLPPQAVPARCQHPLSSTQELLEAQGVAARMSAPSPPPTPVSISAEGLPSQVVRRSATPVAISDEGLPGQVVRRSPPPTPVPICDESFAGQVVRPPKAGYLNIFVNEFIGRNGNVYCRRTDFITRQEVPGEGVLWILREIWSQPCGLGGRGCDVYLRWTTPSDLADKVSSYGEPSCESYGESSCTITRVDFHGPGRIALHFKLTGLAVTQDVSASYLSWEGGQVHPCEVKSFECSPWDNKKHRPASVTFTEEHPESQSDSDDEADLPQLAHEYHGSRRNAFQAGSDAGIMIFKDIPATAALKFTFGEGGFSEVPVATPPQEAPVQSVPWFKTHSAAGVARFVALRKALAQASLAGPSCRPLRLPTPDRARKSVLGRQKSVLQKVCVRGHVCGKSKDEPTVNFFERLTVFAEPVAKNPKKFKRQNASLSLVDPPDSPKQLHRLSWASASSDMPPGSSMSSVSPASSRENSGELLGPLPMAPKRKTPLAREVSFKLDGDDERHNLKSSALKRRQSLSFSLWAKNAEEADNMPEAEGSPSASPSPQSSVAEGDEEFDPTLLPKNVPADYIVENLNLPSDGSNPTALQEVRRSSESTHSKQGESKSMSRRKKAAKPKLLDRSMSCKGTRQDLQRWGGVSRVVEGRNLGTALQDLFANVKTDPRSLELLQQILAGYDTGRVMTLEGHVMTMGSEGQRVKTKGVFSKAATGRSAITIDRGASPEALAKSEERRMARRSFFRRRTMEDESDHSTRLLQGQKHTTHLALTDGGSRPFRMSHDLDAIRQINDLQDWKGKVSHALELKAKSDVLAFPMETHDQLLSEHGGGTHCESQSRDELPSEMSMSMADSSCAADDCASVVLIHQAKEESPPLTLPRVDVSDPAVLAKAEFLDRQSRGPRAWRNLHPRRLSRPEMIGASHGQTAMIEELRIGEDATTAEFQGDVDMEMWPGKSDCRELAGKKYSGGPGRPLRSKVGSCYNSPTSPLSGDLSSDCADELGDKNDKDADQPADEDGVPSDNTGCTSSRLPALPHASSLELEGQGHAAKATNTEDDQPADIDAVLWENVRRKSKELKPLGNFVLEGHEAKATNTEDDQPAGVYALLWHHVRKKSTELKPIGNCRKSNRTAGAPLGSAVMLQRVTAPNHHCEICPDLSLTGSEISARQPPQIGPCPNPEGDGKEDDPRPAPPLSSLEDSSRPSTSSSVSADDAAATGVRSMSKEYAAVAARITAGSPAEGLATSRKLKKRHVTLEDLAGVKWSATPHHADESQGCTEAPSRGTACPPSGTSPGLESESQRPVRSSACLSKGPSVNSRSEPPDVQQGLPCIDSRRAVTPALPAVTPALPAVTQPRSARGGPHLVSPQPLGSPSVLGSPSPSSRSTEVPIRHSADDEGAASPLEIDDILDVDLSTLAYLADSYSDDMGWSRLNEMLDQLPGDHSGSSAWTAPGAYACDTDLALEVPMTSTADMSQASQDFRVTGRSEASENIWPSDTQARAVRTLVPPTGRSTASSMYSSSSTKARGPSPNPTSQCRSSLPSVRQGTATASPPWLNPSSAWVLSGKRGVQRDESPEDEERPRPGTSIGMGRADVRGGLAPPRNRAGFVAGQKAGHMASRTQSGLRHRYGSGGSGVNTDRYRGTQSALGGRVCEDHWKSGAPAAPLRAYAHRSGTSPEFGSGVPASTSSSPHYLQLSQALQGLS